MRVLCGMPSRDSLGGPAACEPPFVAALRGAHVEVAEEVYVYGEGQNGSTLQQRITRVLRTARSLRRRMLSESFDIVHLNTSFDRRALLRDAAVALLLPRSCGKLFWKFHGSDADLLRAKNSLWRALRNVVLRRAAGIGVLSSEERRNFIESGVAPEKVFVVKNAVEEVANGGDELFAKALGDKRQNAPVLLFIARFIPAKGLLDTIRACRILEDEGRRFMLLCVGDGAARAEAEDEVARLKLNSVVRFCGYIPEEQTGAFYRRSSALVFPTYHYEGFPMVIFRSVAAGLPVITTRIRAAADYLREPENCLWVEPRSPLQLAARIRYLLDHPDAVERMKQYNFELAQRFTAERVAAEYEEVYRRLIAQG